MNFKFMENIQKNIFRQEVQFIAWIVTTVLAITIPYFTYVQNTKQNDYRITQIEENRKVELVKQSEINNNITDRLGEIKECLAVVKRELKIE